MSAQGLKALELTKDGLPSQDDLDAAQSNDVFELYAETRRDALRCHRALSLMQKSSLTDWVEHMDKAEFKVLIVTAKRSWSAMFKRATPFSVRSRTALKVPPLPC